MTTTARRVRGGVGESVARPDAVPKLRGDFAFASDHSVDGMLWAATVRSPHPSARVLAIDVAPALSLAGVHTVLTAEDVPGLGVFGLEYPDQPVFARSEVRFWGEPVAVVAAENEATARAAAAAVEVTYDVLEPVVDPEVAVDAGSVFRTIHITRGDQAAGGPVVVEGYYETGMQDQAPLGTEAGIAVPDGAGGVDLWAVSQWTHVDRDQIAACLGLAPDAVRVQPTGVGGAFGSREDLSLQVHLCLLALRTGRPVKMVYDRRESFTGHVHRHPARMWYRHEADADGTLVKVTARVLLDGGAYASTSSAVLANASYFAVGPYRCDNVAVEGIAARTNNPPCGAMRGFGAVQVCFGYESQMDRLAAALDMDPVEVRLRNALATGDRIATTGQLITTSLPTRRVLEAVRDMQLPAEPGDDPRQRPGGTGLTTDRRHVTRGIGYAVGIKNLSFSEGFDDFAEARVVLTAVGAEVHTAAVDVGQGMVTVLGQIARTALGMEHVVVLLDHTSQIGSAGSSSASRQTQMTGGAVLEACTRVRELALARGNGDDLDDDGVWRNGELVAPLDDLVGDDPIEHHVRFRHRPTSAPDETGQGNIHVDFAVAAHRAVVDVDTELGLVRVVQVDTAQDVGIALNPDSVIGQIEGGIAQGVGLAVMEELVLDDGVIRNPNFTDYLLPTFADMPVVNAVLIEEPGDWGPWGAKGVGEPPTISSTPAIAAAIRAATGRPITKVPVRPDDIVFGDR
jgi:xanthine dehydrogenase D subunit